LSIVENIKTGFQDYDMRQRAIATAVALAAMKTGIVDR